MTCFRRGEGLVSLLALAMVAGCAGGATTPKLCDDDSGCASGSRCIQRSCAANAPPVAVVTLPEAPEAFALVTFDASGSLDPDAPVDAIAWYTWTFSRVDAPCEPPESASSSPQAAVRFGCPGRYAVELLVSDRMGATGVPARQEFEVLPSSVRALLEVSPDLVVDHTCSGDPLVCRPEGILALSAATPGATGDVTYSWTVEPPADRPLDASRRVRLEPSADVPNPTVVLETDGTAISGDWIFRVSTRDAAGLLGTSAVRITVKNRPPVIEGTAPTLPHVFDPALSLFSASGFIAVKVTDPDGDPIQRERAWRHTGDGESQFVGLDLGSAITVEVRVPYAKPEDALHLIGGAGLERSVELTVRDVNGAETPASWPIVIENRPPVPPASSGTVTSPHSFDPATSTYRAAAQLPNGWTDPDGDPLFQAAPTGDLTCAEIAFVRSANGTQQPRISCSTPFASFTSLADLARQHSVTVSGRDPWQAAAVSRTASFTIGELIPLYRGPASLELVGACKQTNTCCRSAFSCISYEVQFAETTVTVTSLFSDPDGDPMKVTVGTTSQVCSGSGEGCAFTITVPAVTACPGAMYSVAANAFDGVLTRYVTLSGKRTCTSL